MAKSKKGRLSGAARKEINKKASNDAVEGRVRGIAFARVTKMVGENHIRVAVPCKTGYKEFTARIPNKFGKKGSTPLTTNHVVSIYVGEEFDPNENITEKVHFDVTSILDDKQAYQLVQDGTIPGWMMNSPDEITSGVVKSNKGEGEGEGFEFDYLEGKTNADGENEIVHDSTAEGSKYKPSDNEEMNIDDI